MIRKGHGQLCRNALIEKYLIKRGFLILFNGLDDIENIVFRFFKDFSSKLFII